ncbi:MAG: hypothetical protein IPP32_14480 [Bacteroidetes bacterium]|nr:hypothetical protein [Bacteroidota bacterium]
MSRTISTIILLFFAQITYAQISGMWHNSQYDVPFTDFSMKLKGNVKTWTMTQSNGQSRTMTFDKSGNLITDTYSGTRQTFIPPDFTLIKLKGDLEKPHSTKESKDTSCIYNDKMQLVERGGKNSFEKNLFDSSGKIMIHQKAFTYTETRAWNSDGHLEPTYSYTIKPSILAFFKYSAQGNLKEISYFNSDPFDNLRIVYIYDENNNMIETKRYDHLNIEVHNMKDNYMDTIMKSAVDTNFSIEAFYPKYWGVGLPAINKWKYNDKGQKIEYDAYGYKPNGGTAVISFISKWEYDEKGKLNKEIQYGFMTSRMIELDHIIRIIEFDQNGNVVKENQLGYADIKDKISEMKIEYYEK